MFEHMTIYIPTMGRLDKQITLEALSPELKKRVVLAVDHFDAMDHFEKYKDQCRVLELPMEVKGISEVRQHCMDVCNTKYIFLLDDDMVFFKRKEGTVKLARCTDDELNDMFTELLDWMDFEEIPLVGVSARQGNNHTPEDFREATRQMNFHGLDLPAIRQIGLKFNGLEVMEDFNMTLDLLTKGIANRVFYKYCWNQFGSGADGGCSEYRTGELQRKCAEELEFRYPDFVKVVVKKSKTAWKGMEERYDVRVQWKKAYEWGLENVNR